MDEVNGVHINHRQRDIVTQHDTSNEHAINLMCTSASTIRINETLLSAVTGQCRSVEEESKLDQKHASEELLTDNEYVVVTIKQRHKVHSFMPSDMLPCMD
jgi:hypothetical protein